MISSSVTSWTLALETLTWSFSVSCARAWLAGWWLTWFSWPSPTPRMGPSPQHWPWWWYSKPCMWPTPSGLRWVSDVTTCLLSRTTIMWRKMRTNILILFYFFNHRMPFWQQWTLSRMALDLCWCLETWSGSLSCTVYRPASWQSKAPPFPGTVWWESQSSTVRYNITESNDFFSVVILEHQQSFIFMQIQSEYFIF